LAAAVAEAGRDNEPGTIVEVRSPSPLVVHYVKVPAVECVHLGGDR
jgi:hypothetical protein